MSIPRDRDAGSEEARRAEVEKLLGERKAAVRGLAFHLVRTAVLVNLACIAIIGTFIENDPQGADDVGPLLALSWFGVNLVLLSRSRKRSAPARELQRIDEALARRDT